MVDKKNIEYINNLESNFRSDVVAAGMVDSGIDADKIVILRRQGNIRQTDKEVVDVEYKQDYEGNGRDVWLIKANRQGIYDQLPEGMFHDSSGMAENSKEAIVHSFRRQNMQERLIRKFFSFYEAEAEYTRVDIQLAELRYDRPDKHRAFVDTMSGLWPVVRDMDSRTAMLFIRTVPYIAQIRGSYGQTAQAISMITGHSVRIEDGFRSHTPQVKSVRLAEMKLGVNSALRGAVSVPCAKVSVTPNRANLAELVPGKTQYGVLKTLLDVFLPNEVDYEIAVKPSEEDYTSRLGDKNHPCILGVNMRLKSKHTVLSIDE